MSAELHELLQMGPLDLPESLTWPEARAQGALDRVHHEVNDYEMNGYPDPTPAPSEVIKRAVDAENNAGRINDPVVAIYAAHHEAAIREAFDIYRGRQEERGQVINEARLGQLLLAWANITVNDAVSAYHGLSKKYRGHPSGANIVDGQMTDSALGAQDAMLQLLERQFPGSLRD